MSDDLAGPAFVTYARAAVLGLTVGLRSMTPVALLAVTANQRPVPPAWQSGGQPWRLLRSRGALVALSAAAAGELVVDKLPFAPSRLSPPELGFRLVGGALVGALLARSRRRSAPVGGSIGALAAGAGAFGGYRARKAAGGVSGLPDPAWAVVEDIVTVGLGLAALGPDLAELFSL